MTLLKPRFPSKWTVEISTTKNLEISARNLKSSLGIKSKVYESPEHMEVEWASRTLRHRVAKYKVIRPCDYKIKIRELNNTQSLYGFKGSESIALGADYRNEKIIWEWADAT